MREAGGVIRVMEMEVHTYLVGAVFDVEDLAWCCAVQQSLLQLMSPLPFQTVGHPYE